MWRVPAETKPITAEWQTTEEPVNQWSIRMISCSRAITPIIIISLWSRPFFSALTSEIQRRIYIFYFFWTSLEVNMRKQRLIRTSVHIYLSLCKSMKLNELRIKSLSTGKADGRTDGRTDGWTDGLTIPSSFVRLEDNKMANAIGITCYTHHQ